MDSRVLASRTVISLVCGVIVGVSAASGLLTKLPYAFSAPLDTPAFVIGILVSGNVHRPNEVAYFLTVVLIASGLAYLVLTGIEAVLCRALKRGRPESRNVG